MRLLRHLLIAGAFLCCLGAIAGNRSADDILRSAAGRLSSSPSVEAQFTVHGQEPVQGNIVMDGPRFAMTTPLLCVWFDGHTQWTQLQSTSEVSITEPTATEIMESNPFAILRDYSARYRARRLPDAAGKQRVELTPLPSADTTIEKAIIVVDSSNWPAAAEIRFTDGRSIIATIDHIGAAASKPASAFRFDTTRNPAVEIIDLR